MVAQYLPGVCLVFKVFANGAKIKEYIYFVLIKVQTEIKDAVKLVELTLVQLVGFTLKYKNYCRVNSATQHLIIHTVATRALRVKERGGVEQFHCLLALRLAAT